MTPYINTGLTFKADHVWKTAEDNIHNTSQNKFHRFSGRFLEDRQSKIAVTEENMKTSEF
ncbi:hypothetical protein A7L28_19080 [Acinetobacter baumannii]|nr:hypothetical protein A7L28_19080 [Acinetobacter baumannii]